MKAPLISKIIFKDLYRFYLGLTYIYPKIKYFIKWLIKSKETTNFTYRLNQNNYKYLINFIASITNTDYYLVKNYFDEIENDKKFFKSLSDIIQNSKFNYKTDLEIRLCRRVSWYALIRILKPKVVTESGIDKGLGSSICSYALSKNSEEGFPGKYYGIDVNPDAGFMLYSELKKYSEILIGDSISILKTFNRKIDIHICDSHQSKNYELQEYEVIFNKMNGNSIIISDNAHGNDALLQFALKNNKMFKYFHEIPESHFYGGEGMGFLFWSKI